MVAQAFNKNWEEEAGDHDFKTSLGYTENPIF